MKEINEEYRRVVTGVYKSKDGGGQGKLTRVVPISIGR